jgi:hypothetical protein
MRSDFKMKVLIGCECTGVIRDAFRRLGHEAYSCDLLPDQSGRSEHHIQGDIIEYLESCEDGYWDIFIVHPDCTYLTISAEWCYKDIELQTKKLSPDKLYGSARREAREHALAFVKKVDALGRKKAKRTCMENPVGKINTVIRKPDQYIQPHEYGHDASKKTGLWLRNLPKLIPDPANKIEPRWVNGLPRWANQTDSGQNRLPPSADRWLHRATTYQGWADAMAEQWGRLQINQKETYDAMSAKERVLK